MCSEIKPPEAGLATYAAQFTYEAVRKVVSAIQTLRKKGMSEEEILGKIDRELRQWDPHSRRRMYDKSLEAQIPDDFPADQVESEESPKPNTVILKMRSAPKEIREDTLAQHKGQDYHVAGVQGLTYTLKKLVPRELRKKK